MRISPRAGRILAVAAMATAGIAVSASPALANHGAFMTVSYYGKYQAQDCANMAALLNLNPFDQWESASCHVLPDGRIALVAKHV